MPLVTDPIEVEDIYQELEQKKVCLAAFCTSSPEMTEAALISASQFAREHRIKGLPLCVAFTSTYPMIQQTVCYTACGNPLMGFKMIMDDLELFMSEASPYRNLRLMAHLDHGQPEGDREILENNLDKLATVMYDCSTLPFEENIKHTARFVETNRNKVRVEGAVDEIYEVGESAEKNELTRPEDAERYYRQTGVFLITPNIGTEHRSTKTEVHYRSELAREISRRVGRRLVIHGTSGLSVDDLTKLRDDGIIKVNIWTIFERLGGQAIAAETVKHLGNILPAEEITKLQNEGFLGRRYSQADYLKDICRGEIGPKLSFVTAKARRENWMEPVIRQMKIYLEVFGYQNLA